MRWVYHFPVYVDIIGVRVYGCQVTKHNTNISKLEIRNNNKIVLLLITRRRTILFYLGIP